jgi:trimethylamine--corrinoid protein Co-methyltransferase
VIDGAKDGAQRANEKYKQLLKVYEKPPLDPAVEEALLDFITRRKHEIQN